MPHRLREKNNKGPPIEHNHKKGKEGGAGNSSCPYVHKPLGTIILQLRDMDGEKKGGEIIGLCQPFYLMSHLTHHNKLLSTRFHQEKNIYGSAMRKGQNILGQRWPFLPYDTNTSPHYSFTITSYCMEKYIDVYKQ